MSVLERRKPESAKIYDDDGRTVIPKGVRDALDVGKGDTILFYEDDEGIKLFKAEE